MTGQDYDVIVIGAGINGAAIARELALCAKRVLLLDQGDVGSGTSATSTRLIHGGLRYLEYGELGLVYESLHERERLLRTAPHLVEPLGLYLPVYAGGRRRRWQVRAGLALYDLLSWGKSLPRHRILDRGTLLAALPEIEPDGLVGGAYYFDAQVRYPERLVVENVRQAIEHGAELRSYTRVSALRVANGAVKGVNCVRSDGARGTFEAPVVINAAGPWLDRIDGMPNARPLLGGTKGSHLIVGPFSGAPSAAVYTEAMSDGRPFFVIPWNGLYLIGTTDERYTGDPSEASISDAEFHYLIAETRNRFPAAKDLADHVLYTQAGVRPLPRTEGGRTGAITRRHIVHAHREAAGLYSIVGGKLTTHRALAEDVLKRLRRRLPGLPGRSPTRERALPGALDDQERDLLSKELTDTLDARQARRLWRIYGAGAKEILASIRSSRELAMVVGPTSRCLVAELVHALENEWAETLADVLQRRCMAGLDADFGLRTAPEAARCLVRLGLWDRVRAEQEVAAYTAYARRFRVGGR